MSFECLLSTEQFTYAATHGDSCPRKLMAHGCPGNAQLVTDLAQGTTFGLQVGCTLNVHRATVTSLSRLEFGLARARIGESLPRVRRLTEGRRSSGSPPGCYALSGGVSSCRSIPRRISSIFLRCSSTNRILSSSCRSPSSSGWTKSRLGVTTSRRCSSTSQCREPISAA